MQVNHINIPVADVPAAAGFLTGFFGLEEITRPSRKFALLGDGAGMVFALSNFEGDEAVTYPSAFHVGFMLDSREKVDAMHARLAEAGHTAPAPRLFHGSWTFYVQAPGGFTVEVQKWEGIPANYSGLMSPSARSA